MDLIVSAAVIMIHIVCFVFRNKTILSLVLRIEGNISFLQDEDLITIWFCVLDTLWILNVPQRLMC
jgi:Na+/alanine symporter